MRGWRPVLLPFSLPVAGDNLVAMVANSVPALAIWTALVGTAYWVTGRWHRKGRRLRPGRQERLAGALLATANGFGVWWLVLPAVAELTPPVPDVWPSLTDVVDIVRTAPDGVRRAPHRSAPATPPPTTPRVVFPPLRQAQRECTRSEARRPGAGTTSAPNHAWRAILRGAAPPRRFQHAPVRVLPDGRMRRPCPCHTTPPP